MSLETTKKTSMKRKLFLYMIILAVIITSFLGLGMLLLGNYSSTKQSVSKDLSFQLSVYDRQINNYFDNLSMMASSLSENISQITESYLNNKNIEFTDLNDNLENITGLQKAVFHKLHEELLKTDCSGAFIIFNATVNTKVENAEKSKTGLYFERSSIDARDNSVLLYRGIAELGRDEGIMPHRKWRLEFNTDYINNWDYLLFKASLPIEKSTYLSDAFILPGTSEKAMHYIIPVISSDNILYGYCGFEISETYFKTHFAQGTQLKHLTCLFTKKQDKTIDTSKCFFAGIHNGYFLSPVGTLKMNDINDELITITGESDYVGLIKEINICNNTYFLSVMTPKIDYTKKATTHTIQNISLVVLILCIAIVICIYFSRKFLKPLLDGIEQIKKQEHKNSKSTFVEIDDLFIFLTKQDELQQIENSTLKKKQEEQLDELNKAKTEIARLSYSRKNEVDPDDYEMFKNGIKSLTKTEVTIFKLYLEGKSAEEILNICQIQQSTLKYHNHNILSKLGVSSRKQMLRYATLLKQEDNNIL